MSADLHTPKIVTDGGPWAKHDQACAVCYRRPAVLVLDTGLFQQCWSCQSEGWTLMRSSWLKRKLRGRR